MDPLEQLLQQIKTGEKIPVPQEFKAVLRQKLLGRLAKKKDMGDSAVARSQSGNFHFFWQRLGIVFVPLLAAMSLFFYYYEQPIMQLPSPMISQEATMEAPTGKETPAQPEPPQEAQLFSNTSESVERLVAPQGKELASESTPSAAENATEQQPSASPQAKIHTTTPESESEPAEAPGGLPLPPLTEQNTNGEPQLFVQEDTSGNTPLRITEIVPSTENAPATDSGAVINAPVLRAPQPPSQKIPQVPPSPTPAAVNDNNLPLEQPNDDMAEEKNVPVAKGKPYLLWSIVTGIVAVVLAGILLWKKRKE